MSGSPESELESAPESALVPTRRPGPPAALGLPAWLEAEGLTLAGVLDGAAYDALVPPAWQRANAAPEGARSAVLLASTGSVLFQRFRAAGADSLDVHTRALCTRLGAELPAATHLYCDTRAGVFADFVALGVACGLGAPSRLGLLVHPRFGPWPAIRALVLTPRALAPTAPDPSFDPCTGCPAPCASACPVDAPTPAGFAIAACGAHRRSGACATRCDARHACVLGRDAAYAPEAEAWHQRAALGFASGASSSSSSSSAPTGSDSA